MNQRSFFTNGCSPDKALWCELESITNGLSWKNISLDQSKKHRIPKKSGVYIICAEFPLQAIKNFNACIILYAGQSKSCLRTRFLQHSQRPGQKLKPYISCFYPRIQFWFAPISDVSLINKTEGLLIAAINPPCNSIQAPGAHAIIARIGTTKPIGKSSTQSST